MGGGLGAASWSCHLDQSLRLSEPQLPASLSRDKDGCPVGTEMVPRPALWECQGNNTLLPNEAVGNLPLTCQGLRARQWGQLWE